MISPLARLTLAFILTATINLPAIADVILLRQAIQETPENSVAGLERPISGMPMSEVAVRFGQPLEKRKSVGTPRSPAGSMTDTPYISSMIACLTR